MSQFSNHSYNLTCFSANTVNVVFPGKIFIDLDTQISHVTLMF